MNTEEVMAILPHRYPFLLVDRIEELDDENQRIVGVKNVTVNEPFFVGHFPGKPVMPGVLQLEVMAQVGGILLMVLRGLSSGTPYFMGVDKARFRRVIQPGDQLRVEIQIQNLRRRMARFTAVIKVGEEVASEAELMCMLADEEQESGA